MNGNLTPFGASLDGKELFVLPGLKSLILRDEDYGYMTVVPAITESGRHVMAVSRYGCGEDTRKVVESGLKDVGTKVGTTQLRDIPFVKVETYKPAMRMPASMNRLTEFLSGAGFGDKLDSRSLVEVEAAEAMELDVPLGNKKPLSETIERGLKAQDEAVLMGLRLTCESAKSFSFGIYPMLHGKDHIGYELPFMVSRMKLEGESEKLQPVVREALQDRFGENLVRCTVTPEEGFPVLEYAVRISPEAVQMLSEQTYPVFQADSQHNCIRVVEFRCKDTISKDLHEQLDVALKASAAAVKSEMLEGDMAIRVGFPAYNRLPANKSEDLQQRVEFVERLLSNNVEVADKVLHETLDLSPDEVKTVKQSNGDYKRVSKVNMESFAYSRIVGAKDVKQNLAAGRLGEASNGGWYFEASVPGHVLALIQGEEGKVTAGYFVEKGVTEDRESARTEAKRLLALV